MLKVKTPAYLVGFRCIGGSCPDSCCIGWDVDIDEKTYKKYKNNKNTEIAPLVKRYLFVNEYCFDPSVDYAKVALKDNKWCPFLDQKKWCKIQSNLGEEMLSSVCTTFPRIYNELNGKVELSLTLACPEAAKMLFRHPTPFKWEEIEQKDAVRIWTFRHKDQKNKGIYGAVEKTRDSLIAVATQANTTIDLINRLNEAICTLEKRQKKIAPVNQELFIQQGQKWFSKISKDHKLKGTRLASYFTKIKNEKIVYEASIDSHLFPYIQKYVINDMYQNLFPFTESDTFEKSFKWMDVRIGMLYYALAQLDQKGISEDECIDFISAFAKGIEHHHTFKQTVLEG